MCACAATHLYGGHGTCARACRCQTTSGVIAENTVHLLWDRVCHCPEVCVLGWARGPTPQISSYSRLSNGDYKYAPLCEPWVFTWILGINSGKAGPSPTEPSTQCLVFQICLLVNIEKWALSSRLHTCMPLHFAFLHFPAVFSPLRGASDLLR